MARAQFASVDDYIAYFPANTQEKLREIRAIIKKVAPKAEEGISYGIAGYKLHGVLIYFAAFKNHVSVYPKPKEFAKETAHLKGGKGTVQFPLDQPLPKKLITDIVKFRLAENKAKLAEKASKGKK